MITTYDLIACFVCGAITIECLRMIMREVTKIRDFIQEHVQRETRMSDKEYNRQRFEELDRQTQLPSVKEKAHG